MPERLALLTIGLVVFLAVSTAMSGKPGQGKAGLAIALAWLVPGLGHLVLGRWKKAIFFLLTIVATYIFGLWLTGFRTASYGENPFYFIGQYGSGATTLLGFALAGAKKLPPRIGLYDPGQLYVCVAGLLNLVVMFNCTEPVAAPVPSPAGAPASAVPGATPPEAKQEGAK